MRIEIRRPPGSAEDSRVIRLVVAAAVELSILAVVAQGAVGGSTAIASLLLAPLGYAFSYRRRRRRNVITKIFLALGMMVALTQFLQAVRVATSVDQARVPLASLFLWVQVLHSFDVPRRRDLAFSMVSSLILIAEGAALSLTTSFIFFLAPWAVLASVWLHLSSRPRADEMSHVISTRRVAIGRRRRLAPATAAARAVLVALFGSLLVFVALPRVPASIVHAPPFSLRRASPVSNFDGSVSNPGLPAAQGNGTIDIGPGAYPGFSDAVDLESRGRLSNDIAFRVRSPQLSLWRAQAFDTYYGRTWRASDISTVPLGAAGDGVGQQIPASISRANLTPDSTPLTQTFYIDTPQPNVVFAAPGAMQVYFPSGGLRVDSAGSIRSPILLDEGMVYSVVSSVPVVSDDVLRFARGRVPRGMENELQLPKELPARVGDLARGITTGSLDEVDRVNAIQAWLRANTTYDLSVPRDPEGVDAVDHLLFGTRHGFCEQIASAMVVMLRTLGIPARLVTGYGSGTRNFLTGYIEVRQSDAHAWVEVYYPNLGWTPYDPTFGVPVATTSLAGRFIAGPVFAAIGRFVGRTVPGPVRRAAAAVGRAGARAAGSWPTALTLVLAGIAIAGIARSRRRRFRAGPPPVGAAGAFADLVDALARAGHPRVDHQTPSELLGEVTADQSLDHDVSADAQLVVRTFERERFSAETPTSADVMRARAAAAHVRELVAKR
jgi:protein-glutamine gamma-glutamyltransferase